MAQSRLEKIGTIFTRVTGLLRSGAMKPEDKPIWYDVYEAFPPKAEPRFDRPASQLPIRQLFYEEDIVRAKYHKNKPTESINLFDTKHQTQSQQFLKIYNGLKAQGALDDAKIFETAQDLLAEQRQQARIEAADVTINETEAPVQHSSLLSDFKTAKQTSTNQSSKKSGQDGTTAGGAGNINISNLFKD